MWRGDTGSRPPPLIFKPKKPLAELMLRPAARAAVWLAAALAPAAIHAQTDSLAAGQTVAAAAQKPDTLRRDSLLVDAAERYSRENADARRRDSLLIEAAKHCAMEKTDSLLKAGANPNAADKNLWTPLIWIAGHGNRRPDSTATLGTWNELRDTCIAIAALLLGSGADPRIGDDFGLKPHMSALGYGDTMMAELFLKPEYGVNINDTNNVGENALMYVPGNTRVRLQQQHEALEFLLKRGVNPNKRSITGMTVSMRVAAINDSTAFDLLARYGAYIDAVNEEGKTAFMLAKEEGHTELAGHIWQLIKQLRFAGAQEGCRDVPMEQEQAVSR